MPPRRRTPALPLLREALRSGEAFPPYFSIDDVEEWLAERDAPVARRTLWGYLSDLLREELLYDAGRGWYCRHKERPTLDTTEVRPLLDDLSSKFPFLEMTAWSTGMLNPWLHHLVGSSLKFVHVERDALGPVAEHLEAAGWKVVLNPTKASSTRFSPDGKTVVLRPLNVYAPKLDGPFDLLAERVLVDLRVEVGRLGVIDMAEYHDLAFRLAKETRLMMRALLRYSARRKLSPEDIFGNRVTALFRKKAVARF